MSLPTYIRNRRHRPEEFLARAFNLPVAAAKKIVTAYRWWEENDYDGYYINPPKRHVRPFWLVPKLPAEQEVVLGPAGSATDTAKLVEFQVDTQGHFEVGYTMMQALSTMFLVEILDGGNNNKSLMNVPVHARTIAGSARRPLIWPESYFLNVENAPRSLFCNFRNLSPSENRVRWTFHGRRWYHKEAPGFVQEAIFKRFQRMEKTYTYFLALQGLQPFTAEGATPGAVTLAPGQLLQENSAPFFKATDEADTEVQKTAVFSDGPFEFQLRESQSGRSLSNGFIRVESGWGDGEFPFVFGGETFLIERNYEVLFEVRNLHTTTNRVFPTMIGRRLQYA